MSRVADRGAGLLVSLLVVTILTGTPREAHAWGKTGHRALAQIAEEHLSPEAEAAVRELLGARSLAQVSIWADFVRSEEPWKIADNWHYLTVEEGETFEEGLARRSRRGKDGLVATPGNVVQAIRFFSAVLRGDEAETEAFEALMTEQKAVPYRGSTRATALAFLVHFVGDIHQPLHVGRGGDRGGNQVSVNWFDELSNLHSVWDSDLIDGESLSFTELATFLEADLGEAAEPGGSLRDAISKGVDDWAREAIAYRHEVYEIWARTDRTNHLPDLSWRYVHDHLPKIQRQLYVGGRRLGALLDSIFEPTGAKAKARGRKKRK